MFYEYLTRSEIAFGRVYCFLFSFISSLGVAGLSGFMLDLTRYINLTIYLLDIDLNKYLSFYLNSVFSCLASRYRSSLRSVHSNVMQIVSDYTSAVKTS